MIIVNLEDLLKQKEISAMINILLESSSLGIYNVDKVLQLGNPPPSSDQDYPIKVGDNIIGWVRGQQEKQADILAQFLSYIAQQEWENKLLTLDALDKYEELTFIYEFSQKLATSSRLDYIIQLIIEELERYTNNTAVLLFIFNPKKKRLELYLHENNEIKIITEFNQNKSINNYIFSSKKAEIINNIKLDERCREEETIGSSLIAAPLLVYDQVIGIINLINEETGAYTTDDLILLISLTSQMAAAIQTAQLSQYNQDYFQILEDALVKWTFALEQANKQLQKLAIVDELTQITNRRGFEQYFNREYRRMKRDNKPLSLILCDVDYFKKYNDRYGHKAGDKCLKKIAQTIDTSLKRAGDLVCRYGGEEFAIILPDTDSYGAVYLAETIREHIQMLNIIHESSSVSNVITLSMGIATTMATTDSQPDIMLETADRALYQAKQQGRNRYRFLLV